MDFNRYGLSDSELLYFYKELLKPRLIEEKMIQLAKEGRISKWFSGFGQEAIGTGVTLAMDQDEYILPLHRNLGVFTARGISLKRLFAQFEGKPGGFTKGRDRTFHFGSRELHLIGMISHLGPQLGVADGIALAHRLRKENKAVAVFSGDGAVSEGDFHEAVNVAAVWDLPVIFVIENNGYGLSTPSSEQYRHRHFIDKGPGYGIDAFQVDGNNILEVNQVTKKILQDIRGRPRPVLLEAITFRMRGHEEATGTAYVPEDLLRQWAAKDPVTNFEQYLLKEKVTERETLDHIRENYVAEIENGLETTEAMPWPVADTEEELKDVYAPFEIKQAKPSGKQKELNFGEAISEGIRECMKCYPEMVVMGQDIAEYGGSFRITEGMYAEFGKERIRNTPLCESAIVGAALGLSIAGIKSIVEMQFADFVSSAFTQVVDNLAKIHYRWGQPADTVIRMPTGGGVNAGPFHSQTNEAWFFHTPGLKIVYPSNPADAKGLLISAVEDPNPVMYFEHKAFYRTMTGKVPEGYFLTPIGKAGIIREGRDLSVITYGLGVRWALQAAEDMKEIDMEILDLRTLLPWDKEAVERTVIKTKRVIILHEDCLTGGIGGEIAAWIGEHFYEYLDAPVMREGSMDTPVPFSASLEKNFLPERRFRDKLARLASY